MSESLSPPSPSALARFSLVIIGLMRAVQARSGSRAMTDAVIMLLSRRVLTISHHVRRLALAIQMGTLRTRRSPAPGGTRRPAAPAAVVLPRGNAWLLKLMGSDAAVCGGQLLTILEDPEMGALLAASPRLVRTLKPLCRMLGVAMPARRDPVPEFMSELVSSVPGETTPAETTRPCLGEAARAGDAAGAGGDAPRRFARLAPRLAPIEGELRPTLSKIASA